MKEQYRNLNDRSSPNMIVHAISKLNEKQREEVTIIDFAAMLHLEIQELPSKLGCWIVDNFDPKSCTLKLSDDNKVHMRDKDVENALGLPRGEATVVKKLKK
ncbi:unnamed protein product [Cuscuta europaea]|uniref:Uncharacterized protein n=1 Tax=Cuscuta europaea TaxID=41803 RepID=A0A9P0YLC5_CUSEU|nr:unnamed protein product [Cuscuta europaea]